MRLEYARLAKEEEEPSPLRHQQNIPPVSHSPRQIDLMAFRRRNPRPDIRMIRDAVDLVGLEGPGDDQFGRARVASGGMTGATMVAVATL